MEFQDNPKFGVVTRAFVVLKTLYTIVVLLEKTNLPPLTKLLAMKGAFICFEKKKLLVPKSTTSATMEPFWTASSIGH
jgi:hypothetical protein